MNNHSDSNDVVEVGYEGDPFLLGAVLAQARERRVISIYIYIYI